MIVSVPREVKNNEHRVAITASGVHELVAHGHRVLVEAGAGTGSGTTTTDGAEAPTCRSNAATIGRGSVPVADAIARMCPRA